MAIISALVSLVVLFSTLSRVTEGLPACLEGLMTLECRAKCIVTSSPRTGRHTMPNRRQESTEGVIEECLKTCNCSGSKPSNGTAVCPFSEVSCNSSAITDIQWTVNTTTSTANITRISSSGPLTNTMEPIVNFCFLDELDTNKVQNLSSLTVFKTVSVTSGNTSYWLSILSGNGNNLFNLTSEECHDISIARITDCGISNFSDSFLLPPQHTATLSELSVEIYQFGLLPVIMISWSLAIQDTLISNVTIELSMTNVRLATPKKECVNNLITLDGRTQNNITWLPEDFQNYSIWLCFYTIKVKLSYDYSCGQSGQVYSGNQLLSMQKKQVILEGQLELSLLSSAMNWNSSTYKYDLAVSWMVPIIYDTYKLVTSFTIFKVKSFVNEIPLPDFGSRWRFRGEKKLNYSVVVQNFDPDPSGYSYQIFTSFGFQLYKPRVQFLLIGPFKTPGEPPSAITDLDVVQNITSRTILFNWSEPLIKNGYIIDYIVEIKVFQDIELTIFSDSQIVNDTQFTFNLSTLNDGIYIAKRMQHRVIPRNENVAATNTIWMNLNLTGLPKKIIIEDTPDIILTIILSTVIPAVVTIFLVLALILIIYYFKKANQPNIDKETLAFLLNDSKFKYGFQEMEKLSPAMVDRWHISLHHFNSEKFYILGKGNFSTVYYSTVNGPLSTPTPNDLYHGYSEEAVALKILNKNATEKELMSFLNEAEIMKRLSQQACPYIVQLVGIQVERAPALIVMELVPCGNLLEILRSSTITEESDESVFSDDVLPVSPKQRNLKRGGSEVTLLQFQKVREGSVESYSRLRGLSSNHPCSDYKISMKGSQLLKFAAQVTHGMQYLVSCGVIHRDLACRNLLLNASGIIKISDFGLSCILEEGKTEIIKGLPTENRPLRWMSVEAFEEDTFSEASDVWSFGVTMWEIFSQGCFPYPTHSDSEIIDLVKNKHFLEIPENCNPKAYNVMLKCWNVDAKERPNFKKLQIEIEEFLYDIYNHYDSILPVVVEDDKSNGDNQSVIQ